MEGLYIEPLTAFFSLSRIMPWREAYWAWNSAACMVKNDNGPGLVYESLALLLWAYGKAAFCGERKW